jgi:hypothetical protein
LIRPGDPDIYTPGLYFRYIRKMTDLRNKIEEEKRNKKNNKNKNVENAKIDNQSKNQNNQKQEITNKTNQ